MRRWVVLGAFVVAGCGSAISGGDPTGDESDSTGSTSGEAEADVSTSVGVTTAGPTTVGGDPSLPVTSGDPTFPTAVTSSPATSVGVVSGSSWWGSGSSSTGPFFGDGCQPPPACSQGIYDGSLNIQSSDDIGLIAGYTGITGSLQVTAEDLYCLEFLSCLETVGDSLYIADNPNLEATAGLSSLEVVGLSDGQGDVLVSGNNSLFELGGFNNLLQLRGNLRVLENDQLLTISGFGNLVAIDNDLSVQSNPQLADLSGLTGLSAIGNNCFITFNENLCLSETAAVCGDLEQGPAGGSTAGNDDSC